jgi:hypothetical protein
MPPDAAAAMATGRRRIVAVQGTAQLASAVAAMRAIDRAADSPAANHLLIHNLSCPADQADEFAGCIARLAGRVAEWATIHHVNADELAAVQKRHATDGLDAAAAVLAGMTGAPRASEILLGQNLLFLNHLIDRAHPGAVKACYGDGVGLNFSTDYFRPPEFEQGWRGLGRRLEREVRRRIHRWTGAKPPPPRPQGRKPGHAVSFDRHYLLLANRFDSHVDDFVQLEAEEFRRLFAAFVPEIDAAVAAAGDPLAPALARAARVVVLLTSNFSETARMSLAEEVEACVAAAAAQGSGPGSLLVVKPHPRDSREKVRLIAASAARHFAAVVPLDDPWTFHLPFESVYDRWFLREARVRRATRVVCTSSAGLSLEALYDQPVEVLFGERIVRRLFAHNWRSLRVRHEADLRRIIAGLRAARLHDRAA